MSKPRHQPCKGVDKLSPDGSGGVSSFGEFNEQRVADHGEVFAPPWTGEALLVLAKQETERIDARFLEPACGSGTFISCILQRKLVTVAQKHGRSDVDRRHCALLRFMCIYGFELLTDDVLGRTVQLRRVTFILHIRFD